MASLALLMLSGSFGGRVDHKMLIAEAAQDKRKKEQATVRDSFRLQKVSEFLPLARS